MQSELCIRLWMAGCIAAMAIALVVLLAVVMG